MTEEEFDKIGEQILMALDGQSVKDSLDVLLCVLGNLTFDVYKVTKDKEAILIMIKKFAMLIISSTDNILKSVDEIELAIA